MRRPGAQRRWPVSVATVVAVVLLLSGCGSEGSGSSRAVATTAESTGVSRSPVERAPMAVLPLMAPLAGAGVGIVDGTEVRLLTVTGETIAVSDAPGFSANDLSSPIEARVEGSSVALRSVATGRPWAGAPFAQDCTGPRSEQRGRSVALCGSDSRPPGRIDVADSGGVRTLIHSPLSGTTAKPIGHWRAALLSPDAGRVLAQWSGECEVPTAYFIDAATGAARPVTGERTVGTPNSIGLTWADERTALALLPGGACGMGTRPAGVYAVTDGLAPRLVHGARSEFPTGFSWRLAK